MRNVFDGFGPLPNPAAPGLAFQAGMERGQAQRDERELRGALSRFSANPDDDAALSEVMARKPELGMKLAGYQDKRAFRGALVDYLGASGMTGGSAPMMPVRQPVPPGTVTARSIAPARPGASFGEAFSPSERPMDGPAAPPQATALDLSVLGPPQDKRDEAFLRMLETEPLEAIKIQSTLRDNFMDRVKAERDFYSIAVDELSRVADDAGWQAGLQRLAPVAQTLGADLGSIPAAYPGPDGVRQLMETAVPIKERLDYFLREANMEADNERADRNTDSMIDTRETRAAEQRRINDRRIETTRRGQDITDERGRRGQDLTDSRVRSGAGRRGGKARPTATDAEGRKVEWSGKAWVPVK